MTMKIDPEERDRLLTEGGRFVYRELLSHALRGLGRPAEDDPDRLRQRVAYLEGERAATVYALRRICEAHGDVDWTDDLYLPDVIEKHLARYLEGDE